MNDQIIRIYDGNVLHITVVTRREWIKINKINKTGQNEHETCFVERFHNEFSHVFRKEMNC